MGRLGSRAGAQTPGDLSPSSRCYSLSLSRVFRERLPWNKFSGADLKLSTEGEGGRLERRILWGSLENRCRGKPRPSGCAVSPPPVSRPDQNRGAASRAGPIFARTKAAAPLSPGMYRKWCVCVCLHVCMCCLFVSFLLNVWLLTCVCARCCITVPVHSVVVAGKLFLR